MSDDNESYELEDYISDLKKISAEVDQILKSEDDKEISRAAKYYPGRLNHLILKRNIKSISTFFPFIDLVLFQNRNKDVTLLDLNTESDDIEQLKNVVQKIAWELEVM